MRTRDAGYGVDANQAAIVAVLRAAGCSVELLGDVGRGVPDLAVGVGGQNYWLEVKTPHGVLSTAQEAWHRHWRGQVAVVRTPAEALRAVNIEAVQIDHFARHAAQSGKR